jgi:hypothetical protein
LKDTGREVGEEDDKRKQNEKGDVQSLASTPIMSRWQIYGWDTATHAMKKDQIGFQTLCQSRPGSYQYRFFVDGAQNDLQSTDCPIHLERSTA